MNVARIKSSAVTIEENQRALQWLREYGHNLTGRSDAAGVSVNLNFAGSCNGAREAARVLSAFAVLALPDLVKTAIENCENTIALSVNAISEEVAKAAGVSA